jgi:hypothetical protein
MIREIQKRHFSAIANLILMSLMVGCTQTVSPNNSQVSNAPTSPTEKPTAAPSTDAASTPVATSKQSVPSDSKTTTPKIAEGRYWLGHTGQALEVESDASGTGKPARYRYVDEEGAKPWRSITELQAVKEGILNDGSNYWCLSTMAPKGKVASCTKNGWVAADVSDPQAGKVSENRKLLFSCSTENGKQILLHDASTTIDYTFGKPDRDPELDLRVPRRNASTWQWKGIGRHMSYVIDVPNGETIYSVFWSVDRLSQNAQEDAGVNVLINQKEVATVKCSSNVVNKMEGVDLKEREIP